MNPFRTASEEDRQRDHELRLVKLREDAETERVALREREASLRAVAETRRQWWDQSGEVFVICILGAPVILVGGVLWMSCLRSPQSGNTEGCRDAIVEVVSDERCPYAGQVARI